MTRPLAVLRPEPGNAATCDRIRAAGFTPFPLPLFVVRPLDWTPPDAAAHDALILTSANAARHAEGLARYAALPTYAVGEATARAAREAGLSVAATGDADAAALIAEAADAGIVRALHLGGRETTVSAGGIIAASIPVYASNALDVAGERLAALIGATALLHSARAARRLDALVARHGLDRAQIALAAISPAVAAAAGDGWARVSVATAPDDGALIAVAAAAAD